MLFYTFGAETSRVLQRVKKLAPNWKYESSTASALVA